MVTLTKVVEYSWQSLRILKKQHLIRCPVCTPSSLGSATTDWRRKIQPDGPTSLLMTVSDEFGRQSLVKANAEIRVKDFDSDTRQVYEKKK